MIDIYSYQTGPIQVNTYLVFDETKEAFIVDPGGPSNDLFNMVSAEGLNVTHVIITHGHADHIGAVELMRAAFPVMQQTAEMILKAHRAQEVDSRLMPFKDIIRLIDEL